MMFSLFVLMSHCLGTLLFVSLYYAGSLVGLNKYVNIFISLLVMSDTAIRFWNAVVDWGNEDIPE